VVLDPDQIRHHLLPNGLMLAFISAAPRWAQLGVARWEFASTVGSDKPWLIGATPRPDGAGRGRLDA
jgi:hypothetical protein